MKNHRRMVEDAFKDTVAQQLAEEEEMKIEKALVEASALCGYARSMPPAALNMDGEIMFAHSQWREGLMKHVDATQEAIEACFKDAPAEPADFLPPEEC